MESIKNNNNLKNEELLKDFQIKKEYSLIEDTYKILTDKPLGGGSFGHVYKCLNIKTNKEYSIKVESNDNTNPQLLHEYKY